MNVLTFNVEYISCCIIFVVFLDEIKIDIILNRNLFIQQYIDHYCL